MKDLIHVVLLVCWITSIFLCKVEGSCFENPSTERKGQNVKLHYHGWLTHHLTTETARILLEEKMGFNVTLVEEGVGGVLFQYLADGLVDANLEVWMSGKVTEFNQYVVEEGRVVDGGALGIFGRSGWFVPSYMIDKFPQFFVDYWKSYQTDLVSNLPQASVSDGELLRYDSQECADLGLYWACDGFYASKTCTEGATPCYDMYGVDPSFDMGLNEQMINNLELPLNFTYLGENFADKVKNQFDAGEDFIFYYWQPDPLVVKRPMSRVVVPSYSPTCYENTVDTPEGTIDCDFPQLTLMKFFGLEFQKSNPVAYTALDRFSLNNEQMDQIMALHVDGGGENDDWGAACEWLKDNEGIWGAWVEVNQISCGPGERFESFDQAACVQCEPGTWQDVSNQFECKECGLLSYSNATGSESCTSCPPNMNTCGISKDASGQIVGSCRTSASSVSDCQCIPGYFEDVNGDCAVCPQGAFCCSCPEIAGCLDPTFGTCDETILLENIAKYGQPCQVCLSGSPPTTRPGFFFGGESVTVDWEMFLPCEPPEACLGGLDSQCLTGYKGVRCGACDVSNDYYRLSGECVACPEGSAVLVFVFIIILVIISLYALRVVSRYFRSGAMAISVDFLQTVGLYQSFQLHWPASVTDLLSVITIFNFNTELLAPECNITMDYFEKMLLAFLLPIFFALVLGIMVSLLFLRLKKIAETDDTRIVDHSPARRTRDLSINAYLMFLSLSHTFLTRSALSMFKCEELAGKSFMVDEPSVECGAGKWQDNIPLAVFGVIIYGIGIPALFCAILFKNKATLASRATKRRFASIYIVYTADRFWFELWVKGKKFLLLLGVNIVSSPLIQATFALIVLVISLLMGTLRPYRFVRNNIINTMSTLTQLLILFCGVLFYNPLFDGDDGMTVVVFVAFWLEFVVLLRAIAIEFLAYYGPKFAAMNVFFATLLKSKGCNICFGTVKTTTKTHWAVREQLHEEFSRLPVKASARAKRSTTFEAVRKEAGTLSLNLGPVMRHIKGDMTLEQIEGLQNHYSDESFSKDALAKIFLKPGDMYGLYDSWKRMNHSLHSKGFHLALQEMVAFGHDLDMAKALGMEGDLLTERSISSRRRSSKGSNLSHMSSNDGRWQTIANETEIEVKRGQGVVSSPPQTTQHQPTVPGVVALEDYDKELEEIEDSLEKETV